MFSLFSKYKSTIFWLLVLSGLYLLTRLYHLGDFPIFTDEAIYTRWSQIARNDSVWRFISLTDGKQPMFVWIAMIIMRFVEDPLIAARLVSVGAGFFSMIGLYFLGKELFNSSKVGLMASFLYIMYPFALVYDRMALYESLVGMFAVWSLFGAVVLAKTIRLDMALILGMVIGGGVLTKSNAFFSLALLPFAGILISGTPNEKIKKYSRFLLLCGLVALLVFGYYSILRLSPFYHIISDKNALFVFPFNEWKQHPFLYFESNFFGLWDWFWKYMTIPWVVLVAVSFFVSKRFFQEKVLLVFWALVPFMYLSFFGRTIYPRYVFFMTLSLLPIVSYSLLSITQNMRNKFLKIGILALFFILPLRAGYYILFDFANAPIPDPDKQQYYTDWPSGVGVKEATEFFLRESKKGQIYIATEGTFGLMPYALELYLQDKPNIILKGFWPIDSVLPKELEDARKKYPTYYLAYQPCNTCIKKGEAPPTWPATLVLQIVKVQNANLSVYKINP